MYEELGCYAKLAISIHSFNKTGFIVEIVGWNVSRESRAGGNRTLMGCPRGF
jgi:hypothetical protein